MKVLQINCVWNYGSTGKIMYDIRQGLIERDMESVICYGRGKRTNDKKVYKVSTEIGAKFHSFFTLLFGVRFGHSFFSTRKLISIIKKENPDVVHLHCLNCNFTNVYKLLNFLKIENIPTVLTLHAEIMHTAGCDYAFDCEKWKTGCHNCDRIHGLISSKFRDDSKYCFELMKKAMDGFDQLLAVGVSEWVTERARLSPVFPQRTTFITVHNGIDTENFNYTESLGLREKLNISKDKKIILHVTSGFTNPVKGGKYVLELARLLPEVQFIIVGFSGEKNNLPKNVIAIPNTTDKKELANYYSLADLTLLTSKKETFSVIVAESLCCGTPVVGFEAGAPETIAIKEYSAFVEQGNVVALKEICEEFLANTYDKVKISNEAIEKYNRGLMFENYLEAYKKCIENRKRKVLQVNCVWKNGSTGKIMYDISEGIKENDMQSVVCYGRGQRPQENYAYKVSSEFGAKIHSLLARLFGVQFGHSFFATKKLIRIIKKEKPDIVHLHCLNANFTNVYKLLNFLKTNKIHTILTLHAEIMHTAGCEHAMECEKWKTGCHSCNKIGGKISKFFRDDASYCYEKMKKSFENFDNLTVVGVSKWLTDRAKQSAVFSKNTVFKTIENGIDIGIFKNQKCDDLFEKYGIPKDKKIILHVTPNFNHPIKGGKYFLEVAKRFPEYQFIIVGFNGDEKLLPKNVIPIRNTQDRIEMAKFYSLADITLLTSLKETFSMVVAESLCCGTPVVGFEAGAPETITIPEYSSFTEFGNVELLSSRIKEMIVLKFNKDEICNEGKKKYSSQKMVENYINIYNKS
ncbi:MAG: glycosyltransferase [Oscillospiraceae bacterium]|nr:glycosyltransferase [Oscillospiraceae bacterium]